MTRSRPRSARAKGRIRSLPGPLARLARDPGARLSHRHHDRRGRAHRARPRGRAPPRSAWRRTSSATRWPTCPRRRARRTTRSRGVRMLGGAIPPEQAAQFDADRPPDRGRRGASSVCAHTSPAGDALGSGLALAEVIERTWPGREVTSLLADDDVVRAPTAFLPGADSFVRACAYEGSPDLFVCVDLSQPGPARRCARRARALRARGGARPPSGRRAGLATPAWCARDAAAAGIIVAEFAADTWAASSRPRSRRTCSAPS